ncbi:hypothetical protein BDZ91DRAFT_797587 [Kalaharituber pfeilii]|nr:hypothetical protein BDZ91DRAFT_797587 [Kalaharituber pfeilii]
MLKNCEPDVAPLLELSETGKEAYKVLKEPPDFKYENSWRPYDRLLKTWKKHSKHLRIDMLAAIKADLRAKIGENLTQDDLESTEPPDLGDLAGYEADLKEYRMVSQTVSSDVPTTSQNQLADQGEDAEEVNSNESGTTVIPGYHDSSTEVDTQPLGSEQESSETEN